MDSHHLPDPLPGVPLGSPGPRMKFAPDDHDEIIPDAKNPAPPPRSRRRGRLLAGVALGAVALVAGGVFLVSPFNTIYPVTVASALANARQAMDQARRAAHDFVAPAAVIAASPEPMPTAPAVYVPPPRSSRETQVGELMGLRASAAPARPVTVDAAAASEPRPPAQTPPLAARLPATSPVTPEILLPQPAAATTRPVAVAAAKVPAAPAVAAAVPPFVILPPLASTAAAPAVATPAPPPPSAPSLAVAALAPRAEPAASAPSTTSLSGPEMSAFAAPLVVVPVPASAPRAAPPRDVLAIASNLRAAPASSAEQVELLALVSEMATMVKDTRNANHQMRDALAAMREKYDFELVDFARRVAFAEARSAMTAARSAGAELPLPAAQPTPLAFTPVSTNAVAARPAAAAPPGVGRPEEARRRYRVQAASPGLAMLSEIDRTGDGGTPLQIAVGDEVPGYGRVTAIAQTGNSWVVRAERGNIE